MLGGLAPKAQIVTSTVAVFDDGSSCRLFSWPANAAGSGNVLGEYARGGYWLAVTVQMATSDGHWLPGGLEDRQVKGPGALGRGGPEAGPAAR